MRSLPIPFVAPVLMGTSAWLLRLRWLAVFGQLGAVFTAGGFLGDQLPWWPLLSLIALTAVTNAMYGYWLDRINQGDRLRQGVPSDGESRDATAGQGQAFDANLSAGGAAVRQSHSPPRVDRQASQDRVATSLMIIDLITLTAMLGFSGGIDNPFSLFFFVNLAVGGVILRPAWAWVVAGLAILGYLTLMFWSFPMVGLVESPRRFEMVPQRVASLIAFATCAIVVTHFVTRTAAELTRRERQLSEIRAENERVLRLEGLTTLAAGAAHELATPLSTIDVIARELGRHLREFEVPESVREDVRLIDQELDLCRQILRRMRGAVGDSMADRWDQTTVGELLDCALEGVRDPDHVDVEDAPQRVEGLPLWIPQEAVAQAIRNLIHNGLDAGGPGGRVRVMTSVTGNSVEFRIRDQGAGMSEEQIGRAGEPFYTTKEPGRGMGLGLFLTRNVVTRLGGKLEFRSDPGKGTEAIVTLPYGNQPRH